MTKKRIFAALDIPPVARQLVAEYTAELSRRFPNEPVRWERSEKLHITLKFAGHIGSDELKRLTDAVRSAAASTMPFEVTIEGTGAFQKLKRPVVLWLGLKGDEMGSIASHIAGLTSEDPNEQERPFKPHLTLARIKHAEKCRDLVEAHKAGDFGPISFAANEIVIYQSQLLPTGSLYTPISRHPFTR
jgi:2'-5' RNA ligase